MLAKAEVAGVSMRVHVKTHKNPQIAEMQVGGDKSRGIVASTIPEVELFASAGFRDITYGVCVHASKLSTLEDVALRTNAAVSLLFDSETNLDEAEAFLAKSGKGGCRLPLPPLTATWAGGQIRRSLAVMFASGSRLQERASVPSSKLTRVITARASTLFATRSGPWRSRRS
jgi:hypothetical protein